MKFLKIRRFNQNFNEIFYVSAISSSYVSCQCRPGFTGSGFGPSGCVPAGGSGGGSPSGGGMVVIDPCTPNPCQFGTCSASANGAFVCSCQPGYVGNESVTSAFTVHPPNFIKRPMSLSHWGLRVLRSRPAYR